MGEARTQLSNRRLAVCLLIAVAVTAWIYTRPWESVVERAHRLCGQCGLGVDEIDWLIDDARHATIERDELVELYMMTFADRTETEGCPPCVSAAGL